MENYKEAYLKLFNEVTDIIEKLKEAQISCEEIFLSQKQTDITP